MIKKNFQKWPQKHLSHFPFKKAQKYPNKPIKISQNCLQNPPNIGPQIP